MSTKPGLNLADIAPQHVDVPIGDSFLRVQGISVKQALDLFVRFPKVAGMVTGEGFSIAAFVGAAPDAIAAIIATASGSHCDVEAEAGVERLPMDVQFEVLEAVGGLTFTKGFAPFVEKVIALASAVGSGSSTKA